MVRIYLKTGIQSSRKRCSCSKAGSLTSSPTFALRDSGGGFPLVGDD
ncbi:hypothetical protein CCF61_005365 [Salmonella enterica subsp. enterica serovar Glostrup]|nr:hypothetical protein [Salmonella enterica subsp. enterica serovar Glostrup]